MQETISGRAYVLGDNIDTDQIIPAQWLKLSTTDPEERRYYAAYCLSSVPEGQRGLPQGNVPFVREGEFRTDYTIVVGGKNFGSGSSREHAPLALAEASIDVKTGVVTNKTQGQTYQLKPLGDVLPIIEAGGVFNYAKEAGMLK